MNTWMMSTRGRGTRWAAVAIGSLLVAVAPDSSGSAEHEFAGAGFDRATTGGNGAVEA